MSTEKFLHGVLALVAVAGFCTAGPAMAQTKAYKVTVAGGPTQPAQLQQTRDRLKNFHAALRKALGLKAPATPGDINKLWKAQVGCANCNKLDDDTATELDYLIEASAKGKSLTAFSTAWRNVVRADTTTDGSLDEFQVLIKAEPEGESTCADFPPVCNVRYTCPQPPTPKCSRTLTGACVPCT